MSDRSTKPKPRVVIVGGGFGGLSTAKGLADAPFDITLIDRNNHHPFSRCSTKWRPQRFRPPTSLLQFAAFFVPNATPRSCSPKCPG